MTHSSSSPNLTLDGTSLPLNSIELLPSHLEQAARIASTAPEVNQWQTYLLILGVLGFQQWLGDRAPDLTLHIENCSLFQANGTNWLDVASHLQIGPFKICVMTMGVLTDETVAIPQEVLEDPTKVAHFYVLTEVLEEQAKAHVYGYFRYDQWINLSDSMTVDVQGTYQIPVAQFLPELDRLLLYLRTLDEGAIALPGVREERGVSRERDAMNVGMWLREQLDTVAQEWAWVLMSSFEVEMVPAFRAIASTSIEPILDSLRQDGIEIPSHARGAYRDLHSGSTALRLHALVWDIPDTISPGEWALLIVLTTQPNALVPMGIILTIRDETQILIQEEWLDASPNSHLYAQVIGDCSEQFWVSIDLGHGVIVTFPPFIFSP